MVVRWTETDIPDQTGRVAIVTGANTGIGWETARALAQKGAMVILACRNLQKANPAADQIRALNPAGQVVVLPLDLADLDSVRAFAATFRQTYDRLDLLINNAGIMNTPYARTPQGFEQQFATNHLGHFALTGLL
ncbi:MAG TPA: SDR family NAD(P)-dependent oxidoreductase, partial [Phototrophicaceae bacterium]|nr:SDR family NAD(P)-dependent oxidoreductase [Phototrophicaceae bacterium]